MQSLKDIDKIDSPNAKLLALRKVREEVQSKINELYNNTVACECGYRMWKKEFDKKKIIYINPNDPNDREIYWVDCPCCGKQIYNQ